jgi:hypothetical protein
MIFGVHKTSHCWLMASSQKWPMNFAGESFLNSKMTVTLVSHLTLLLTCGLFVGYFVWEPWLLRLSPVLLSRRWRKMHQSAHGHKRGCACEQNAPSSRGCPTVQQIFRTMRGPGAVAFAALAASMVIAQVDPFKNQGMRSYSKQRPPLFNQNEINCWHFQSLRYADATSRKTSRLSITDVPLSCEDQRLRRL